MSVANINVTTQRNGRFRQSYCRDVKRRGYALHICALYCRMLVNPGTAKEVTTENSLVTKEKTWTGLNHFQTFCESLILMVNCFLILSWLSLG